MPFVPDPKLRTAHPRSRPKWHAAAGGDRWMPVPSRESTEPRTARFVCRCARISIIAAALERPHLRGWGGPQGKGSELRPWRNSAPTERLLIGTASRLAFLEARHDPQGSYRIRGGGDDPTICRWRPGAAEGACKDHRHAASILLSDEKQIRVKAFVKHLERMGKEAAPPTKTENTFTIGMTVPSSIVLFALPEDAATDVPKVTSYQFFVAEKGIIAVDLSTRRVVQVIG